jgi:Phosphotransferase enzyme family
MSSAVHVLHLEGRSGERFRLVLRRYVREDWLAEEPDVAAREADALRILEDGPLPVPRLVAVDLTGELAGSPALLMTALPGRVDWSPRDLNAWLKQLVAVLPVIHATRIPEGCRSVGTVRTSLARNLFPRFGRGTRVPGGAESRRTRARSPAPSGCSFTATSIRNLLWRRRLLTGVVDWANASLGALRRRLTLATAEPTSPATSALRSPTTF